VQPANNKEISFNTRGYWTQQTEHAPLRQAAKDPSTKMAGKKKTGRFKVLTAVLLKTQVFWYVTPYQYLPTFRKSVVQGEAIRFWQRG
jgi:hypothetical protein